MFGRLGPVKERFHRWQKIISHGAANTAIGQFHHIFVFATLNATADDQFAVDAKITKLVDNQRNAFAAGIFQHVADHGGFART